MKKLISKILNNLRENWNPDWKITIFSLLVAIIVGLIVFPLKPFPSDSYLREFDSYNDSCKNLKEKGNIQGKIFFSNYGPLIIKGQSGSFSNRYNKKSDQKVRIRYKNYPIQGFSFNIKVEGNKGKSYEFNDRFDLFERPLYLGTLDKSDSFTIVFSGQLSQNSPAKAAYLNDQIEVIVWNPSWSNRSLLLTFTYLTGILFFTLISIVVSMKFVSPSLGILFKKIKWEGIKVFINRQLKPFSIGLLIALSINIAIISSYTQKYSLAGDTPSYVDPARSFWQKKGFPELLQRTPGYPLFIVFSDLFFSNPSYDSISQTQSLLFALLPISVFLAFYLGTKRFLYSIIAGFLICVDIPLWTLPRWILTESFTCICVSFVFIFFAITLNRPSIITGALTGLSVGFLALVRPSFILLWTVPALILLIPILGSILFKKRDIPVWQNIKRPLLILFSFLGGSLLVIGGWSVRNKIKHNYFGLSPIGNINLLSHLQHYPESLPTRDEAEIEIKQKLIQLIKDNKSTNFSYYRFADAIQNTVKPKQIDFNKKTMSIFLFFVKNHTREYFQSVKIALSYYLRPLNLEHDYRFETTLSYTPFLGKLFRVWNEKSMIKNLLLRPKVYLFVGILACIFLIIFKKDAKSFYFLLSVLLAIFYLMLLSVSVTRDDQNNPRFHIVVQHLVIGLYIVSAGIIIGNVRKFFIKFAGFLKHQKTLQEIKISRKSAKPTLRKKK